MQLEEFLARVVPSGGHYVISRNKTGERWGNFTHTTTKNACYWLRRNAGDKADSYFALASFATADTKTSKAGKAYLDAARTQENVRAIKTLVMDADVARAGDGKDPSTVFHDRRSALAWLIGFVQATGMPMPNLAVDSGYGFHWYWTLEDALTRIEWQPLANALKASMVAHNWTGDTSPTVDAARVLRPPETVNMKSGQPVAVSVMAQPRAADYPVATLVTALAPWMSAGAQSQGQATGTHGAGAGASVSSLGPRPSHASGGAANPQNANASANIARREYLFARIAKHCLQVEQSLANQGNGDQYPLWYRGHLSLAHRCDDGPSFIHEISKGDPRYDPQKTDDAYAQIGREQATKDLGAPRCTTFDDGRRNVCPKCPWYGKLNSPYTLGIEDGDYPDGWRRNNHWLERWKAGEKEWVQVIEGDFYAPDLQRLPAGGFALSFAYEDTARLKNPVRVTGVEATKPQEIAELVARQGISVNRHNAPYVGDFVAAWITKLRALKIERSDLIKPFGWAVSLNGERIGASVAGTLYRADGSADIIPGGDGEVILKYTPMGEFKPWRDAAKLFEGGRVDLQALIATSFAAPLMVFTGVRGLVFNFWSKESGVGKTSAMKVANAIWGSPSSMQSNADTPNAVIHLLSETRFVPKFWDELRIKPAWQGEFVDMCFVIPQGKERARMAPDTTLRPVGEWDTLMVFTANRSIMDFILAESGGTDAGVARAFECHLPKHAMAYSSTAGTTLARVETNYGHAGRRYMAHIAANIPQIANAVSTTMANLETSLKPQNVERYYVAALAACLVGAAVARKLGLFDFQISNLHQFLTTTFYQLRGVRPGQTLVAPTGGYDLEQLLAQFISAHADERMYTETLSRQGPGKVQVIYPPRSNQVVIQISTTPSVMRVDRKALLDWFHKQNLPARSMLEQMVTDWGAVEHRQTLAGGTVYTGGQMWCVDIPLSGSLASYVYDVPATTNPGTGPTRPPPSAVLAGNQPRV